MYNFYPNETKLFFGWEKESKNKVIIKDSYLKNKYKLIPTNDENHFESLEKYFDINYMVSLDQIHSNVYITYICEYSNCVVKRKVYDGLRELIKFIIALFRSNSIISQLLNSQDDILILDESYYETDYDVLDLKNLNITCFQNNFIEFVESVSYINEFFLKNNEKEFIFEAIEEFL